MTKKELTVDAEATEATEPDVDEPTASAEAAEPEEKATAAAPTKKVASKEDEGEAEPGGKGGGRQVSLSVRSLVVGVLIVALVAAVGVLTWLYIGAEHKVEAQDRQSENVARAETIALDYATNAAAMDFQDLEAWKAKLVAGTSPELKDRLSDAAQQMEQILVPLKWDSTARPLAAKVRAESGGVYDVDAFVSVLTKTAQGPDPLQSTATYRVTIDSNKDWQITDVGGIGAAVGEK